MFQSDEWKHALDTRRVALMLDHRQGAAQITVTEGKRRSKLTLSTPEERLELLCILTEAMTPSKEGEVRGVGFLQLGASEVTAFRMGERMALVWTREQWRNDVQYTAPQYWTVVELDKLRLQMLRFVLEEPAQSPPMDESVIG